MKLKTNLFYENEHKNKMIFLRKQKNQNQLGT